MKFCAIIINRNLPKITDQLDKNLAKFNDNKSLDLFVLESGSKKKYISKYTTWHACTKKIQKRGLRYYGGINYALNNLYNEKKFHNYDAYIFIANDVLFTDYGITSKIKKILNKHKRIGILSPCEKSWGEYKVIDNKEKLKYFWFIHSPVYIMRKEFIDDIKNTSKNSYKNFLFDGSNFRGYGLESELIMKAYSNNWAAAITRNILFKEDENLLITKHETIKTENYSLNTKLYIEEGFRWMKKKYGFQSQWSMQMLVRGFYNQFFNNNSRLNIYKL